MAEWKEYQAVVHDEPAVYESYEALQAGDDLLSAEYLSVVAPPDAELLGRTDAELAAVVFDSPATSATLYFNLGAVLYNSFAERYQQLPLDATPEQYQRLGTRLEEGKTAFLLAKRLDPSMTDIDALLPRVDSLLDSLRNF